MTKRNRIIGILMTTAALAPGALTHATAPASLVDLGSLGGDESAPWALTWPWAINNRSQVVGWSRTLSGGTHAFLWTSGTMVDLGSLDGRYSSAGDINNLGQVVGTSSSASGWERAVLWQDGAMIDLGTLGGAVSYGWGINDRGLVVGWSFVHPPVGNTQGSPSHPFLWDRGTLIDLLPGDCGGGANDINNLGWVVGQYACGSGSDRAFLWQDGVLVDLGTLGGDTATAVRINDQGEIVGFSDTATYETHAFVWRDGVMTDLGTLGGPYSQATDINNHGLIVGAADYPLLWHNGRTKPLDLIVEAYSPAFFPTGINDRGQVVMVGLRTSGYFGHAFLWTQRPKTLDDTRPVE